MDIRLISQIKLTNPWLEDPHSEVLQMEEYKNRLQEGVLLLPEWDKQWLILIGPRRAGKTTLGKYLSLKFKESGRFDGILYLNCDFLMIRQFLHTPEAILDLQKQVKLKHPVIFIDEVQRLDNPGLLLKTIADMRWPIKMMASGSSQLEIKSKVQEFLTGRQFSATILPLGALELQKEFNWETQSIYGSYPEVCVSSEKQMQLAQLYEAYISKDVVEFLKVGKPDVLQKLLILVAYSSGQMVNYQSLATDCRVTIPTIQHYLSLLEKTFVLARIQPFVGNKRSEITSNPIYYFIDNGFRNNALGNFTPLPSRNDAGLLIQGLIFQELLKYITQHFLQLTIHYWRSKSGAKIDFVIFKNFQTFIPIEVKFQTLPRPAITRGYRSFLQAYQPPFGIVISKNQLAEEEFEGCKIYFIPLDRLELLYERIQEIK